MTVLQSILLGLLQGVAEFLPISSSGHLKVVQVLFSLEDVPLLFDVFLHLATLLAVCIFFRKKIVELFFAFLGLFKSDKKFDSSEILLRKNERNYLASIVVATIVTGAMGVATKKLLDEDLVSVREICIGWIFTAFLLLLSALVEKRRSERNPSELIPSQEKSPTILQSLIIGFAQGIGTLPGISRSGSTISGALFCGLDRQCAGEFSFIVSIPAILGAFLLELKDLDELTGSVGILPVALGCISAFISGYLSLAFLMKLIKKGRLEYFACYLIPAAILGLMFIR